MSLMLFVALCCCGCHLLFWLSCHFAGVALLMLCVLRKKEGKNKREREREKKKTNKTRKKQREREREEREKRGCVGERMRERER